MTKICIECHSCFEGGGQRCDRCCQRAYEEQYKYKCSREGCHKRFKDYKKFRAHLKDKHGIEIPYECWFSDCDVVMKDKKEYVEHCKKVHGYVPFSGETEAM